MKKLKLMKKTFLLSTTQLSLVNIMVKNLKIIDGTFSAKDDDLTELDLIET